MVPLKLLFIFSLLSPFLLEPYIQLHMRTTVRSKNVKCKHLSLKIQNQVCYIGTAGFTWEMSRLMFYLMESNFHWKIHSFHTLKYFIGLFYTIKSFIDLVLILCS